MNKKNYNFINILIIVSIICLLYLSYKYGKSILDNMNLKEGLEQPANTETKTPVLTKQSDLSKTEQSLNMPSRHLNEQTDHHNKNSQQQRGMVNHKCPNNRKYWCPAWNKCYDILLDGECPDKTNVNNIKLNDQHKWCDCCLICFHFHCEPGWTP